MGRAQITHALSVIPAEAGMQTHLGTLDPGFRRGDDAGILQLAPSDRLHAWSV
jgi:hypothetical protein